MRPAWSLAGGLWLIALLLLPGCATPVEKPEAWDPEVVSRLASAPEGGDLRVLPGPELLALGSADLERGAFVGLEVEGRARFGRVLLCDPAADRLAIALLEEPAGPLDAVAGRPIAEEGGERLDLSLSEALGGRLASPLPPPKQVFAVAANFPSHLEHDLAISDDRGHRTVLGSARPRVFLKHPPTPPPDGRPADPAMPTGILGPFAPLEIPARVALPAERGSDGPAPTAENRFDYEVEIGVVFGRRLAPEDLANLDDDAIRSAVAGYVLMSDAKSRNPQVVRKVAGHGQAVPEDSRPYASGDDDLDAALGAWDRTTCAWWSYGAGLGRTTAIGPYFVLAAPGAALPPRALGSARSYGPEEERGARRPVEAGTEEFLLRQASVCTTDPAHPDAVIWDVPEIVRSILAEDSVLAVGGRPPTIERGDILCLGTPGGTVITARSQALFEVLAFFLSTWTPIDWHDAFFGDDAGLYLRTGDRLLLWAEGLGAQIHEVKILPPPEP